MNKAIIIILILLAIMNSACDSKYENNSIDDFWLFLEKRYAINKSDDNLVVKYKILRFYEKMTYEEVVIDISTGITGYRLYINEYLYNDITYIDISGCNFIKNNSTTECYFLSITFDNILRVSGASIGSTLH